MDLVQRVDRLPGVDTSPSWTPEPVSWWSGDDSGELAVPRVAAVDTAGAGDVFHGALAVALGRGDELVPALRFAIRIAGIRVRHAGPSSWRAALRP